MSLPLTQEGEIAENEAVILQNFERKIEDDKEAIMKRERERSKERQAERKRIRPAQQSSGYSPPPTQTPTPTPPISHPRDTNINNKDQKPKDNTTHNSHNATKLRIQADVASACLKRELQLTEREERLLRIMAGEEIDSMEGNTKGSSCSLKVTFKHHPHSEVRALWKPYAGEKKTFDGLDRVQDQGWAEIVAFHVSTLMSRQGKGGGDDDVSRTPLVVGRRVPLSTLLAAESRVDSPKQFRSACVNLFEEYAKEDPVEEGGERTMLGAMVLWEEGLRQVFNVKVEGKNKQEDRSLFARARQYFVGNITPSEIPAEELRAYKEILNQMAFDFIIGNPDRRDNVYNYFAKCGEETLREWDRKLEAERQREKEGKRREREQRALERESEECLLFKGDCRLIYLDNGLAFRDVGKNHLIGNLKHFKPALQQETHLMSLLQHSTRLIER